MAISIDSGIDLDPAQGGASGPILPGDLPANIDASKIGAGGVGNTEFGFLDGVTSAIQAQLDAKLPLAGGAAGLVLPTTQTAQFTYPSVSNSSGNFRNGVATGQSFEWLQTNTSTYIATLSDARGLVLYNTGSNVDSNQVSKTTNGVDINTLNCMTLSGPGVTFANNDTWTNFYSLARGTHAGNFKIFCALFGGAVTIRITGATISITLDDWGGSYADVTAGTGKIAFRVSGGWLQINVGSGISSTPRKFHAQFEGNIQ